MSGSVWTSVIILATFLALVVRAIAVRQLPLATIIRLVAIWAAIIVVLWAAIALYFTYINTISCLMT